MFLECFQAFDRRFSLHAIVGRHPFSAGQGSFVIARAEYGAPATRARVAPASAIGEHHDMCHFDIRVVGSAILVPTWRFCCRRTLRGVIA